MKNIIFITGASGTGKTTIVKNLEKKLNSAKNTVFYFDTIGVPSIDIMISEHGSQEKWQEFATHQWIERLSHIEDKELLILEGQCNPQFVINACNKFNVKNYKIVCMHCDRKTREYRLIHYRNQLELVNEDMHNWCEFLKRKTLEIGGIIIDSSGKNIDICVEEMMFVLKVYS